MAIAVETVPKPANGMTLGEKRHLGALEKRIAAGLQTFREVGAALIEIRDSRLYRETHGTFESYCAERWGMPRARAYQLMESAKVVESLGDAGSGVQNEAQARELVQLEPAVARQVLEVAEKRAVETNRPMTASLLRRVREEAKGASPTPVLTPTARLLADIGRLAESLRRWQASKPKAVERRHVKTAMEALNSVLS